MMATLQIPPQRLKYRLVFKEPVLVSDSFNEGVITFVSRFERWANLVPFRTGLREQLIANENRAIGQTTIQVRVDRRTRLVDEKWEITSVSEGTTYKIVGGIRLVGNRWIEFACVTGYGG
jgi:hypothetical protein